MPQVTSKRITKIVIQDDDVRFIIETNIRDSETNELIEHEHVRKVLPKDHASVVSVIQTLEAIGNKFTTV